MPAPRGDAAVARGAFLAVARTGVDAALRHRLRSTVVVLCVGCARAPYVAGLAVAGGLLEQAEASLAAGPELTVVGRRFGRDAPVPLEAVGAIRAVPEVLDATPRIVGEITLGSERHEAVLVGIAADRLPAAFSRVEGRLFTNDAAAELVMGRALARRLGIGIGSRVPPFYENERGQRVFTVVGLLDADTVWEANLCLCSFDSAAEVFAQKGLATSVLVRCRPGYEDEVRRGILSMRALPGSDPAAPVRPRVVGRDDARALLPRGVLRRASVFGLHFLLALALGVPLVLLTSGIGLSERRRETGLLKALGWQTDDVLLRAGAESLFLAATAAAVSVLLSWAWLVLLRGVGVADVFLDAESGAGGVPVPFRLSPAPVAVAVAAAFAVVLAGTLLSTWRTAATPPGKAMR